MRARGVLGAEPSRSVVGARLAMIALLAAVVTTACGNSDDEQEWYDIGYEYADGLIEVDGITDRDEIMDECGSYATVLGLEPKVDTTNAMGDGCWERASETEW